MFIVWLFMIICDYCWLMMIIDDYWWLLMIILWWLMIMLWWLMIMLLCYVSVVCIVSGSGQKAFQGVFKKLMLLL